MNHNKLCSFSRINLRVSQTCFINTYINHFVEIVLMKSKVSHTNPHPFFSVPCLCLLDFHNLFRSSEEVKILVNIYYAKI